MTHPLVSVIIPAFNGEDYIDQAISSVLIQTYDRFELIVVDDASADRTSNMVKRFQDPRLRLIENRENIGLTANLNKGIRASCGEYVCWLNQDDIFYADKIKQQLSVMLSNPQLGACFSAKDDIDHYGTVLRRFNPTTMPVSAQDELVQLFGGCYLSAPTVMMRRSAFDRVGGFDPGFRIAFDYDMWFKIKKYDDFRIIDTPLLAFRHHANNLSSERNEKIVAAECAAIIRKNLKAYSIEEIYPFLKQIHSSDQKAIERSACLLSLAQLIWRQKKWNFLLADDLLMLVEKALAENPLLMDGYALGSRISAQSSYHGQYRILSGKCDAARNIYRKLGRQLQTAFKMGNQRFLSEILQKMYAMDPLNGDPYYRLAHLFYSSGDLCQAQSYCKHAMNLNNHHASARNLMRLIQCPHDSYRQGAPA